MPAFRRSAGSPTVDPAPTFASASTTGGAATPPPLPSPSFRGPGPSASNSFSARRSHIDFRRSVPGTSPSSSSAVTSPGEALAPVSGGCGGATSGSRLFALVRGTSEFANQDLPPYASSLAGSESGGPGLDDDAGPVDHDVDSAAAAASQLRMGLAVAEAAAAAAATSAAGLPGRRHSAFVVRSPGVSSSSFNLNGSLHAAASPRPGGISPAARLHTHQQQHLQQPASEEEEFMARLQANRTYWRERSRSSSHAAWGHPFSMGGGGAASTAPYCESGLQNQTHAALERLRCELKSLSMRSMHGSPAAAAAAGAPVPPPPSGPYAAGAAAGGGGGAFGAPGPALPRLSEGQASWVSSARLSLGQQHHSSSGAADGSGGGGGGGFEGDAAPELLPRRLASSPQAETEPPREQAAASD